MSNVQTQKPAPIVLADGKWSEETEAALKAAYTGKDCNERLGKLVEGKTAAAVRSKLVSLGVYEKNDPRAVGGASSVRKLHVVRAIETMLSAPRESLASFEKAKKEELELLANFLIKQGDKPAADLSEVVQAETAE